MTQDSIVKLLLEHWYEWDDVDGAWCFGCDRFVGDGEDWAKHVAELIALGFAT